MNENMIANFIDVFAFNDFQTTIMFIHIFSLKFFQILSYADFWKTMPVFAQTISTVVIETVIGFFEMLFLTIVFICGKQAIVFSLLEDQNYQHICWESLTNQMLIKRSAFQHSVSFGRSQHRECLFQLIFYFRSYLTNWL